MNLREQIISFSRDDAAEGHAASRALDLLQEEPFDLIEWDGNDHQKQNLQNLRFLEMQVYRNPENTDLNLIYEKARINHYYEYMVEDAIHYFDKMIGRYQNEELVWFVAGFMAALMFSGLIVYTILIVHDENNNVALFVSTIGSVISAFLSTVFFTQSVSKNKLIQETRKEKDDRLGAILDKRGQELETLDKKKDFKV